MKHITTLFSSAILACLGGALAAQPPLISMVKNIHAGNTSSFPDIGDAARTAFHVYFEAAGDPMEPKNTQLWRTDGSEPGTEMVMDINTDGMGEDVISGLTTVGGTVFFAAHTKDAGLELWKTDGVTTEMVHDIVFGPGGSQPQYLYEFAGRVYFATGNAGGSSLYVSDGTPQGTKNLKLHTGEPIVDARDFVTLGDRMIFAGAAAGYGRELMIADGNDQNIHVLKDIIPGTGSSTPRDLVVTNSRVFFSARTSLDGFELWTSDGTTGGTQMVLDIAPTGMGSNPVGLMASGGLVFFTADTPGEGRELWASNGMELGTLRLTDYMAGPTSTFQTDFDGIPFQGGIVFTAPFPGVGLELCFSDGTVPGTVLLKDLNPLSSNPRHYIAVGQRFVYFTARGAEGSEMYRTDGTPAGTLLVEDTCPGPCGVEPGPKIRLANLLLFSGLFGGNGFELGSLELHAIAEPFGIGCSLVGGNPPSLRSADPVIGMDLQVEGSDAPNPSTSLLFVGFQAVHPTPVEGCNLWLDPMLPIVAIPTVVNAPSWATSVPIPQDISLVGAAFALQAGFIHQNFVLGATNAIELVLGM